MRRFFTIILIWLSVNEIPAGVTERTSQNRQNGCDSSKSMSDLNSFLWTLKRDPPSYFFGTIHVPYTRVWEYIPDNAKAAFKQSENIFFELDLTDPYTMKALANCQLLPHGENLSNILPEDIYTRLKDHLQYVREKMPNWITADQKGKGLYADHLFNVIAGNWERKRPIWVMLLVNSLTESDIKSREIPVLDLYLAQEAERLRKITGAVEKVEEQCVPLNDLNISQVLFALNQTLWQHESYRLSNSAIPYTTDDLIYHYNCGDLNDIIFNKDSSQVPNLLNASLPPNDLKTAKLLDNYFKTELINKRNERMVSRVAKLLNDHPDESFFFAFGAGHFLGNDTVVDRLRSLGYDIQHTQADEHIPTLRLHKRQRKRKNKIQEDFGDIWDQMDPETRSWIEQTRRERRRKYNSNKPFNDLWIRMETPRPNSLHKQRDLDRTTSSYSSYQNSVTSITFSKSFILLLYILTLLSSTFS